MTMRFYTGQHKHYCGVDLHARSIYVCVLDRDGQILLHRNMPARPETFLKAIHGAKAKNDRIDSAKIAVLLKGGTFPIAYVYPREWRSTRDLLRRRLHLVRKRGELVAHIQNTYHQYNLTAPSAKLRYRANRTGVADAFSDFSVKKNVAIDLAVADRLDRVIRDLEGFLTRRAKVHDPDTFHRLRSIPGVGKILAMTMLYEIHDIDRFPRVQDFASYARPVKCAHESAGKRSGSGGAKIGNSHLRRAFGEAVLLMLRDCDELKKRRQRLERKHGKGKSLAILAHKLGRAVYFMLKRKKVFQIERFLAS